MRAATFRAPSSSISSSGCPVQAGRPYGRHPLPDPETFARGMALSGIGNDTIVVAYDDAGGVIAARLVWMLRATGHEAALLNGGATAYGGPLEKGPDRPDRPPAAFTARAWPSDRLAGAVDAAERRQHRHRRARSEPLPRRAGPHRPAPRTHPRGLERAVSGEPRRRRHLLGGRRTSPPVRRGGSAPRAAR